MYPGGMVVIRERGTFEEVIAKWLNENTELHRMVQNYFSQADWYGAGSPYYLTLCEADKAEELYILVRDELHRCSGYLFSKLIDLILEEVDFSEVFDLVYERKELD